MTNPFLSLFAVFCVAQDLHAQHHLADMRFYADIMVNASMPDHRTRAAAEFYGLFTAYLADTTSRENSLEDLPWLTTVIPEDSTFRMITWQVEGKEDQGFRYYGFIQFLSGDKPAIELVDTRSLNSETASYDESTWYGAIYYGIQPFSTTDNKDAYLLLGFNAYTARSNQRVADVLSIEGSGITLGMPVFETSDSTEAKSRIILEYADAASATMRFDREKGLLIYDHVISINTPEGPAWVPDGSYHGYGYNQGKWQFIDMVFNVIMEEPPGGRPKEAVKRDLFGREKKD